MAALRNSESNQSFAIRVSIVLATLLFTLFCSAVFAQSTQFEVTIPSAWKRQPTVGDTNVYTLGRKMLVTRSVDLGSVAHLSRPELLKLKSEITETRKRLMEFAGIKAFTILNFEETPSPFQSRAQIFAIEASYIGLTGNPIQLVERDFFVGDRILQVTYFEESGAIADRDKVRNLLNAFRPVEKRKSALLNKIRVFTHEQVAVASELKNPNSLNPALENSAQLPSQQPVDQSQCTSLVKEETQRRKVSDPPFLSMLGGYNAASGCVHGGGDFAQNLSDQLWTMGRNLLPGYAPYRIIKSVYQYGADPAYRAEADVKAALVAEATQHPQVFATKALAAVTGFISARVAEFPCFNNETQWRVVCKVASEIGETLATGAMLKLAMGGALVGAEVEKASGFVASAMRSEVAADGGVAAKSAVAPARAPVGKMNAAAGIMRASPEEIAKEAALEQRRLRAVANAVKAAKKRPHDYSRKATMLSEYKGEEVGITVKNEPWKVKYLSAQERAQYKVHFENGRMFKADGTVFDSPNAIFVMDRDGNIFATGDHKTGTFHHSSFEAGGDVSGAGEFTVKDGKISMINRKSGHYEATEQLNAQVLEQLTREGVDLGQVRLLDY